uniref:RNA polymerase sigma-70 factor n=1 Tax=Pedobacter schmidteae TaxID=2201271 RepID=UPI001D030CAA|nr:RNA polymerase sigma-70 factor [Pedobacter schmidteae]
MGTDVKHDEEYWMDGFRKGNNQALAHFFDFHYKPLSYFATRLVQDAMEAEDIVANCFVKLWKRHEQFETASNIKAFLYISCRNACLDFLKHLKRKTAAQEEYFKQLAESEENILYQIIEAEFLQLLNEEIQLLPDKCKEVFNLIYFEGKKTDEIAVQLNLSVKTVRNHKARAVALLKTAFLKDHMTEGLYLALLLFLQNR